MSAQSFVSGLPFARKISGLRWKARDLYHHGHYRRPIYDVLHYIKNREPTKLYQQAGAQMAPRAVEEKVIRALREDGIAIIHINDLLPPQVFEEARAWAEKLVAAPAIRERIELIESGRVPDDAKAGKSYLVRLLGDMPAVDINDAVVRMSLSAPVLRIVDGYLGLFARFSATDLWYNMATPGPATRSQRWHRDPEDKRLVKTFLYLRDVDETNGPFNFVRGSHNGGRFKDVRPQQVGGGNYPEDGFVEKNLPPDVVRICTGKAGTLIFCDTSGFHKGGQPTGAPRLMFTGVYTTNAGIQVLGKARQYRMAGAPGDGLDAAAKYALGHLADMQ
jgi:Phytanoyl-CoA dioxygenase (PhyH)